MPKQSHPERVRARARLGSETILTADELAPLVGRPARSIERYISRGCRGIHLDGYYRPDVGWLTSLAAWERFQALVDALGPPPPPSSGLARAAVLFLAAELALIFFAARWESPPVGCPPVVADVGDEDDDEWESDRG